MRRPGDPGYTWPFARFLEITVGPASRLMWRIRVQGLENIPDTHGAILAGNHSSYADPVFLWCFAPRRPRFMGKSEIWDSKVMAWAVDRVGAFPVRRGAADRQAIRMATDFLAAGELVGMFPEGTRNQDEGLGQAHGGVAFVSMRSGASIIPVGIVGTDRIRPKGTRLVHFPRVTISFGAPVCPEAYEHLDRKDRQEAMTADVMRRITEEIDRAKEM